VADNIPLISIGMPVYNGERFISRALYSLLAQDYEDFELIISDNASEDATPGICEEYARKDRRLVLLKNTENIGAIQNFLQVLTRARGQFFMWAAHDDYRDRNYISALLEDIAANECLGLSCPRVVKVTPEYVVKSVHLFPEEAILHPNVVNKCRALMAGTQSAWVYGLFRTALLRPIYFKVSQMGVVWAADHLIILNFLLNQRITGTNRTSIYQTKTGLSAQLYKPKALWENAAFAGQLLSQALKILLSARLKPFQKLQLLPFLGLYLEMQVFHWRYSALAQFPRRVTRHFVEG
jgi:glycosyltransferase involved in cell wall biosynthesis